MFPGPGSWTTPEALFHLSDGFGFDRAPRSIAHVASAAKLRIFAFEKPSCARRLAQLDNQWEQVDEISFAKSQWVMSSPLHLLMQTAERFSAKGHPLPVIQAAMPLPTN